MNSRKVTAMGLVLMLGISAAACASTSEETEEVEIVAVEVQTPRIGSLALDTAYIGTVAPQEQVYVMPKTSGTVTETFFAVGDSVQEGDVLFKIDDEAAQLQMANARASYESAQAGVTAQNGGARNLQNYQTEEQIRQLRDSLYDTDDQIAEMEDNLGDLRDQGGEISAARNQAQAALDAAEADYFSVKEGLEGQIVEKTKALDDKSRQLDEKMAILEGLQKPTENAGPKVDDLPDGTEDAGSVPPVLENDAAQIEEEIEILRNEIATLQGEMEALQNELTVKATKVEAARQTISQLDGTKASIEAGKTQIKSGIDQLENGQDTIRDNLAMAEQAYAITQNEIYPQTDAVSASQLQMASIGIDSAQMQLDFCTVTSPISGIVESVSVEKNGMAAAGNPAYIISNKESMTVTFFVAEKAKNVLNVGDHITVERNENTYDGTITEIGTMANAQTKLFQVKASVAGAGTGESALPNGVSVKVYATTQKEDHKLIIPYDSIYFSAGDAYVYCVEDHQIVRTEITVGLMSDDEAIVEDGITEDSQVVNNWSSKLRSGVEVEIVSVNGEAVETQPAQEDNAAGSDKETEEKPSDSEEPEEVKSTGEESQEASEGTDSGEEEGAVDGESAEKAGSEDMTEEEE